MIRGLLCGDDDQSNDSRVIRERDNEAAARLRNAYWGCGMLSSFNIPRTLKIILGENTCSIKQRISVNGYHDEETTDSDWISLKDSGCRIDPALNLWKGCARKKWNAADFRQALSRMQRKNSEDSHLREILDNNDDKTMGNLPFAFNECECEFRVAIRI